LADTFDVNDNSITQKISQDNSCFEQSTCNNAGSNSVVNSGQDDLSVDQRITQHNLCLRGASCSNGASFEDVQTGSNSQKNTCVGATCTNGGQNSENFCFSSADCQNTGIDTKVISHGDPCNSGANGSTTVCADGRVITLL
jgi:hypothetical protein